ncbi:MAG: hypothetical protein PHW13_02680 [Methylococcales bacterium]|nr:hypothetical protein [Methylococcales bacterium]
MRPNSQDPAEGILAKKFDIPEKLQSCPQLSRAKPAPGVNGRHKKINRLLPHDQAIEASIAGIGRSHGMIPQTLENLEKPGFNASADSA